MFRKSAPLEALTKESAPLEALTKESVPLEALTKESAPLEALTKESVRSLPAYVAGESVEQMRARYPEIKAFQRLASNENPLGPSPKAIEAMRAAASSASLYPDSRAPELRRALARFYGVPEENVFASSGATGALELLTDMFICPGDEVVFCSPTYMAYSRYVARNMGVAVQLPLTAELKFDLGAMLGAITPRTKMVMICNPNNPTGTTVGRDELAAFIGRVPPGVIVLLDEAYIEFSDGGNGESLYRLALERRNLAVLRTFSKLYGLAGERVGYAFAHREMADLMNKSASFFTVTRIGQAAGIAAIGDREFAERTAALIREGRAWLGREFAEMGFKTYESQANFIYADTGYDALQLAEALKPYGLLVRGNFELSRVTIGTAEQNAQLAAALWEIIRKGAIPKRAA
ncbi:MAG: histidinol-phosphate transaminase [Clostridiales bacterium]|jgi:histidinol-phosphate aminotransferase|nr:histidinol-phosphate transaminase [Clostridiales bacterium]